MTKQGEPQSLAEVLQGLEPGRRSGRTEPSEARQHVRKNFADIAAARLRGVTWPAIATAMDGLGIRAANGSPLTWRALKTMFYAERDTQVGKPKRKRQGRIVARRRPTAGEAASHPSPPPEAEVTAPPNPPAPPPVRQAEGPYAELERRQEEAKRRRELVAKSRDWNPFDLSDKEASE